MNNAKWKLEEVFNLLNDIKEGETEMGVFEEYIAARAAYDFHHNQINNGYPKGTPEYNVYASKINELKRNRK